MSSKLMPWSTLKFHFSSFDWKTITFVFLCRYTF
jgi:hypothetical protein